MNYALLGSQFYFSFCFSFLSSLNSLAMQYCIGIERVFWLMVYLLFIHKQRTTYWKFKEINSTEHRRKGLCPLTPKEVGIFLSGLGYPSTTLIYIAAGEIYGGDYSMAELKKQFPNLICKVTGFPWWHLQFNMHLRI